MSFIVKNRNPLSVFYNLSRGNVSIKFSVTSSLHKNKANRYDSIIKYRKFTTSVFFSNESASDIESVENDPVDDDENALFKYDPLCNDIQKLYRHPDAGYNLFLIQPRVKYGSNWEKKNSAELKMVEAVALVETLSDWKVVKKSIIPISSLKKDVIFGKGNIEKLKLKIRSNPHITGVFIGIDMLTALQNTKLEQVFGVQVFDRYQIVLRIFHKHARTKEAKLQIALAEIPYLRVKLAAFSHTRDFTTFREISQVGGSGETLMEMRRRLLFERELKLKRAIEKIQKQRQLLRQNRSRNSFPVIAVVGYTNCGKTTLIRSLTSNDKLVPEDKLFATLDVTMHAGLLPSSQKVIYIDTVGFISDVPTSLIQSFNATLEDALSADLIIHVRDISHPDTEMQKHVVLQTLKELNLPEKLFDSIIEVGNKMDLLDSVQRVNEEDIILISATEGTNLRGLTGSIEKVILSNTEHSIQLFKIANGGEEYVWLLKNAAIQDVKVDEKDANYLIVEVVISHSYLSIFKHYFGNVCVLTGNTTTR